LAGDGLFVTLTQRRSVIHCVADSASFSFTQAADYARLVRTWQIRDAADYSPDFSLFRGNGC
jgi:hypothetical protein